MELIKKLNEVFERGSREIKVRGSLSGTDFAEVRATSIKEGVVNWDALVSNLGRFSIQLLASGSLGFSNQTYRIDNSHGFLHEHSSMALVTPIIDMTVSGAITRFVNSYESQKVTN